jgi:hypothetical protein
VKSRTAIAALLIALWAVPALGQGCAMCYSTAAASSKQGQKTLNRAILVLLFPPLGFMTAGVRWALKYGKKRDAENA